MSIAAIVARFCGCWFTAQDAQTIREAFGRARPNSDHARLYAAAVARRQADQIYKSVP